MTDLPPLLEFQKIIAEGVRAFDGVAEHPEGYALVVAEVLHTHGLRIVRDEHGDDDGLREETKAAGSARSKATRKKTEEVDDD